MYYYFSLSLSFHLLQEIHLICKGEMANNGEAKSNGVVRDEAHHGALTDVNVEVKDWVMVDYDRVAYPGEVLAKDGSEFKVSDMIFAGKK